MAGKKSTKPTDRKVVRRERSGGRSKIATNGKVNPTEVVQNPWDQFIGMFKGDKDFAKVKQTIAENRRCRRNY